jgi:hypothetical protein
VLRLLDELEGWVAEIPPRVTPQRFGNLAFRTWGTRLDERLDDLLHIMLGDAFAAVAPLVKPYLLQSFGSFVRLDYGTGHEAAFVLFLLCLALVRFFPLESLAASSSAVAPHPVSDGAKLALDSDEREWTAIALVLFPRYLMLCWRLQDTYSLEPAGSHGVWGLDDHHFIGYILGAAQLRGTWTSCTAYFDVDQSARRPDCLPAFIRSFALTTADESLLPADSTDSAVQVGPVSRTLRADRRDCNWRTALEQGLHWSSQDVRGRGAGQAGRCAASAAWRLDQVGPAGGG